MYEGYLRFWIAATTLYGGLGGCAAANASAAFDASHRAAVTESCGLPEDRSGAPGAAFDCGSRKLTEFGSAGLLAQNAPPDTASPERPRQHPSTACMGTAARRGGCGGSAGGASAGMAGGSRAPAPAANPEADRAIQEACQALPPDKRAEAGCP